ncbi:hypothetical protein KKA15_03015 [Patescibacteria group bacterium]|nr:hypothetical protein [Patescibacteria group bacterium]
MTFLFNKQKTKTKHTAQIIALSIICFLLLSPLASLQARVFEPENILTDSELFDKDSLSKAAIQNFLEQKDSVLARYSQVVEGTPMTATEIIYDVAQMHSINPKFLLTTLEKEQGLLHKSHATEDELAWAMGYGCYGGQCNSKYEGFYDQVESSAVTQNIYVDRKSTFSFQVGKMTVTFDDYHLVPKNQATANLFIYTPYVGFSPELGVTKPYGGNRLFWIIWNRYFTKKYYPDGFVIKNSGNYYLIENNKKRKFASSSLFLKDYSENNAHQVTNDIANAYEDGAPIEFSKNTLVKHPTSGQIFLLADYDTKRPILDNNALALLGNVYIAVTAGQIPTVTANKLIPYNLGDSISSTSAYPQGKLFKIENGQIYLVQDGIKHLVDPVVWREKYNNQTPQNTTAAALEGLLDGSMDRLDDGSFVKSSSGRYYVIATGGERMRIQTTEIFSRTFGLDKLSTAIVVSDELLEAHPAGETIEYIDDTIKDPITPTAPSSNTTSPSGSYTALFLNTQPQNIELIDGEQKTVSIQFKNIGGATWQPETVYLKVFDQNGEAIYTQGQKFPLAESRINNGETGTFYPLLTAPSTAGLLQIQFKLFYLKNGVETQITSGTQGKFIFVEGGETSQVLSHNYPIAVRNDWGVQNIEIRLKNTSKDTTWTSKYTKLKITNEDGSQSSFYDPNDWLDETVAAIPINARSIAPGEEAVFKFTLKVRGVDPKVYGHRMVLELTDLDKTVLLSGRSAWVRLMRVD